MAHRTQLRQRNGRWRKTYLSDFGIPDSAIACKPMLCGKCGYGGDKKWMPVLQTGICPKCGNQENHTEKQAEQELAEEPIIKAEGTD